MLNDPTLKMRGGGTRIGYIDALKGFAILCVVLGHVADGYLDGNTYPEANQILFSIFNIIYAFHMPLFMTISGCVYAVAYFDSAGKPDRRRIRRQIGNIVIVYVVFSVLFGVTKVLFSHYTNKPVQLTDILLIWGKPIDIYWYLYDLILLYLLFTNPIFHKADHRIMTLILMAVALLRRYVSIGWFQISSVLYYALFFYIGFSGRDHSKRLIGNKRITAGAAAVSICLSLVLWDKNPYVDRSHAVFLNSIPLANILIALGLSMMLWYLFENVRFLSENKLLSAIGRYSLEIYVLHCFFTAGLRAVFSRIGFIDPIVSIGLNFAISSVVPVAIALVCRRLGIHELVFRPVNFILQMKK